ncbi:flagellar motor switch protein FliM [Candidatus Nitrospira bockiana]
MAEKVLSQEEVDALLRGVVSGDVDTTPKEEDPGGIKSYDLGSQERIIRGRMPTFEMINDRFGRLQSISWSTALRKSVEVSIVSTQIMKFGDFLKKVPIPSSLSVFRIDPLRGHALMTMNAVLVYLLVDQFFGGTCQTHVKPEGRDFTAVQQRIIRLMVDRAMVDLQKSWQAVIPAKVQYLRSESNPQFAMIVSMPEIVMAVLFRVDFGDSAHDLFIVYPYAMIEPIKEKLYAGFFSDHLEQDTGWAGRFHESLQDCAVEIKVQLGTATVRVKDVLHFSPGDVLVLDQSPGDLIVSAVEGLPKFLGNAGVVKGNRAFRIAKVLNGTGNG